jgi:molybdopterin converting factor small subunit
MRSMTIRIVPFARIREIVGSSELARAFPEGTRVGEAFVELSAEFPALAELQASTRFVRGGAFVTAADSLADGDELGLLPPFGGG